MGFQSISKIRYFSVGFRDFFVVFRDFLLLHQRNIMRLRHVRLKRLKVYTMKEPWDAKRKDKKEGYILTVPMIIFR